MSLFATDAPALAVRGVYLSGNQALRPASRLRSGQALSDSLLAADRAAICSTYAAQGYFWTTVATRLDTTARGIDVHHDISEGARARLGAIRLAGNRRIATGRLSPLVTERSGDFSAVGVELNIRTLLDFYNDNGFPFCRVRPESLTLSERSVSYVLVVSEGSEVRLNAIRFTGSFQTRPALLERMLGLKLGGPYSESETRHRVSRLATDPLLDVTGYEIRRREDDYWLDVALRERKANQVSGALAWSAGARELLGEFRVNLDNLFGTRRAFDFTGQFSGERQDLSLSYTEPWLLNTGISVTGAAANHLRDTSYSATGLSLTGQVTVAEAIALRLETGYDLVASGLADLPSARTWWVGSGAGWNSLTPALNPMRGGLADLAVRAGSRRPTGLPAQTLVRTTLDAGWTIPVFPRTRTLDPNHGLNFTLAAHARSVFSPDTLYEYDFIELGGANSLRGYKEGQLRTMRCAWLSLEPRYLPGRTARIYPFFDLAAAQDPVTNRYDWYPGYGAGLRIETAIGLIGLDYGLAWGVTPWQGKIHFSIQTGF